MPEAVEDLVQVTRVPQDVLDQQVPLGMQVFPWAPLKQNSRRQHPRSQHVLQQGPQPPTGPWGKKGVREGLRGPTALSLTCVCVKGSWCPDSIGFAKEVPREPPGQPPHTS